MNLQNIFPVLLRRDLLCLFKCAAEIKRIAVSDQIGDIGNGQITIRKKIFCLVKPDPGQIFYRSNAIFFLK